MEQADAGISVNPVKTDGWLGCSEPGCKQIQIDVAAESSGEDFRLGVNHEYLSQVFGVIESEQMTFEFEKVEKTMPTRDHAAVSVAELNILIPGLFGS